MASLTGCCPVCRHRFRMRKNRTLQAHRDRGGQPCPGAGQEDRWAEHNRQARARAEAARRSDA